jgi:hypothetical protein
MSAASRDGVLLGISGIEIPRSAPAMEYGIVDDSVSQVVLEFTDGEAQELELFRLEDVGFFYGLVPNHRQVRVIALNDAWGRRLATATCQHGRGIGKGSMMGGGCGLPDPKPST